MDGPEAAPETSVGVELPIDCGYQVCACTKTPPASVQVSNSFSPRDEWRHKAAVASVSGNDPLTKNLDNDKPRPFVAVKITVAHFEFVLQQHVGEQLHL